MRVPGKVRTKFCAIGTMAHSAAVDAKPRLAPISTVGRAQRLGCFVSQVPAGPPTAVGSAVAFCGVDNKDEIRDFLASRRAKISPEQSGLPTFGENRRVPGLRREEVAMLSGVSVDYYTRLERDGRCA